MSTIATLWPVKAFFEKRAATVEVDTFISPAMLRFRMASSFDLNHQQCGHLRMQTLGARSLPGCKCHSTAYLRIQCQDTSHGE